MSFKSKQRAKHGLLFGDDPLNAISTTSTPTIKTATKAPIPSSSTTTRRTSSSTNSRSIDPLFQSSSSPGTTPSLNNGSIFGGIDVSKFGNKRNNPRSSTSLRPSPSLKTTLADSDDNTDDIDHLLFGDGGRRKTSTSSSLATSATKKSTSSSTLPNGYINTNGTILVPTPLSPPSGPPQKTSPPPDTLSPLLEIDSPQPINKVVPSLLDNDTIKKPPPLPPARRSTSSVSKTSIAPLVSSSTSSLSSFSSTTTTSTNSSSSSSPVLTNTQSCPPPPPPRTHKKHLQQQDPPRHIEPPLTKDDARMEQPATIQDNDTQRMQRLAMMEDEGTRAFAGTITPRLTTSIPPDDPKLSIVPTNPWVPPPPPAFLPPTTQQKEIEPAKRVAFADLIAHWHGDNTQAQPTVDEHFYDHVACEQRDIGFAGIETRERTSFNWQQEPLTDDNPWS